MRQVSLLDVAPTISRVLGVELPDQDGRPIEEVMGWRCKNAILVIVDSLGYSLFRWLEPHLQNVQILAREGIVIEATAVADSTTPAIASILSGLLPEHHGIFSKEGAKESSILSLPEIANASGLKSAVIMDKNGAEVYKGLIDIIGEVAVT